MEVIVKGVDRKLSIQLKGDLDHHAARKAMLEIDRAIDAALPLKAVMDFSEVTFMDSSGIAVILRAQRRIQDLGGKMTVVHVPVQAKKVLDAAGIGRYVEME